MQLLKPYSKETGKGIIISTHKEFDFCREMFMSLAEKYNILTHTGALTNPPSDELIKLNMTANSRCKTVQDIPFSSRNFLSHEYKVLGAEIRKKRFDKILKKYKIHQLSAEDTFDFIYVGRCDEIKKTQDVYTYLKWLGKKRGARSLMIVLDDGEKSEYCIRLFNEYEQDDRFIIIDTELLMDADKGKHVFRGFSPDELVVFYNSSRFYIHGSEAEGESRTIHEALCCGCMVAAKKNMIGGGLDHLNSSNSVLYSHWNWKWKLSRMVAKKPFDRKLIADDVRDLLVEDYTSIKFAHELYARLDYICDFDKFLSVLDLNELSFSLPAHNLKVPWYLEGNLTSDIKSREQQDIFRGYLEEMEHKIQG